MPAGRTFTIEESRRGGLARQAQHRIDTARTRERMMLLAAMSDEMSREDITTAMLVSVIELASLAVTGELPAATTALEARHYMEAAATALKLMRLEMGESTANTINASVSLDDLAQRIERLRAKDDKTPAT